MTEGEVAAVKKLLAKLAKLTKHQSHYCMFASGRGRDCPDCAIDQLIVAERKNLREVTKSWEVQMEKAT